MEQMQNPTMPAGTVPPEPMPGGNTFAPRRHDHLPTFKSHKIVRAGKIKEVMSSPEGVRLELECNGLRTLIEPSPGWMERALRGNVLQLIGGYYVVYDDDYDSWSPASAFEKGYVPVPPAGEPEPTAASEPSPQGLLKWDQSNPCNKRLSIEVMDARGPGGAHHHYRVTGFDSVSNPSDPFVRRYGRSGKHTTLLFQNGPVPADGSNVNGITHEVLLAVIIDRLESWQRGEFQCAENEMALQCLKRAQQAINARTERRQAAGTEGTLRP